MNKLVNSNSAEERKILEKEIENLEHICDQCAHKIYLELSKSFITPFDREDIHRLASSIDEIADYIHGASKRIALYNVTTFSTAIIKLAELILLSTIELQKAVNELKNLRNMRNITDACVRINSIENHADDIYDNEVGFLFENETNAINLIKQKEILAALETATDMAEDVANVLESILVKIS
jgi:predicted phosphate transport protein (TIGR00153 family)